MCIHFLPRIHKPNNPGRPIVSGCGCPTKLISRYQDKIMAPIVNTISDDSETGAMFSQPPLISIQMRQKPAQATSSFGQKFISN